MSTITLLVRKDKLDSTRLETREDAPLADGYIRVRVDSFALTSNNITYAAFGDAMDYWQFFPTRRAGLGIVPVWGFATVRAVAASGRGSGRELYGYWPMSNQLVLQPDRLEASGFIDARTASRRTAPALQPVPAMQRRPLLHAPGSEDVQAILRPLFITSWLIDDFLADNDFFGARTVLLSSASSKTAYGTAFQLIQRPGIEVVGLTSRGQPGVLRKPGLLQPGAHLQPARPVARRYALRVHRLCRQCAIAAQHPHAASTTSSTAAR